MSDSLSPSPRGRPVNEDARLERMQQILAGARACFVRSGFHASSISEISAAAAVSPANIYQYYPNKEALIIALIEDGLQNDLRLIGRIARTDFSSNAMQAALAPMLTEDAHDAAALRAEIISEAGRNPDVARMVAANDMKAVAATARAIEDGKARGQVRPDVDSQDAAEQLSLFYEAVRLNTLTAPDRTSYYLKLYLDYLETLISLPN